MERTKWTSRRFTFDCPEGWIYNVLERLRGTYPRMLAVTGGLTEAQLEKRIGGDWSLKEQIGHLYDLEELHIGRLDDFEARKEALRPAEMSNAQTYAANHNTKSLEELLKEFLAKRNELVSRFENLDDETQRYSALHPRLQIPMRPIDVAIFTAEHDDHHLATMREIVKSLSKK